MDEPFGGWDDELSALPEESRRRIALKRGAYVTVCGTLVLLIFLTIVFVGNDTTSARVSANGPSTTTTSSAEFATSLPTGATATSLSEISTSTSSTTTTLAGVVVLPKGSTTTSSTTTTAPPPFNFNPPVPKTSTVPNQVKLVSGDAASCPIPGDVQATFTTNPPGTLQINTGFSPPVSGPVSPSGGFNITDPKGNQIVGVASQVNVKANYTVGGCAPTTTYAITWTFK